MSVKEVKDYYMKMTSDYIDMKKTLDTLESEITPETAPEALKNIESLKKSFNIVQENYNRISYIMYLLNMPQKKQKQKRWMNQEHKRIENIPTKDTLKGIQEENKANINNLKQYINC